MIQCIVFMEINKVIKKPILTESSLKDAAEGKFTFEVGLNSTKGSIAQAAKAAFGVDAVAIRTRIAKGKRIRRRGTVQERAASRVKKATIILASGQKIPGFGG